MKNKFPFDHVVNCNAQEVWVKCDSSITAIGILGLVKKYYPGYAAKICNGDYLNKLKNQLVN